MRKFEKNIFLIIFLFILIAGCSTNQTVVPLATQTISAKPRPVATDTAFLNPSLMTASPSTTQLSTLSSTEAESLILGLLENNGGCLFPCWLGLYPGKTSAETAKSFLKQFDTISLSSRFHDDVGGVFWQVNSDDFLLNIIMSYTFNRKFSDKKVEGIRVKIDVTQPIAGGGFETIWESPINKKHLQRYILSQVLADHGEPEDVFVFANEGWNYFELVLDYSSHGFAVWYSMPLESSNDKFYGCPSKFFFNLYSWMPELNYTWSEGVAGNDNEYEINSLNRDFLPLEKATSFSLTNFVDTFKEPANNNCIETPKEIWPGP